MPMCQNINDFNRGCGLVLAMLYAGFPGRVTVHADRLERAAEESTPERVLIYGATVEFLADEGYLTYTGKAGPEAARVFSGVRLTSKGLAALNRMPEVLRPPGKTVGDTLVEWSAEAAKEGIKDALAATVRIILGGWP